MKEYREMRLYGLNRRKLLAVIVFLRSRTELSHVFPVFREDFDLPVASLLHGLPPPTPGPRSPADTPGRVVPPVHTAAHLSLREDECGESQPCL